MSSVAATPFRPADALRITYYGDPRFSPPGDRIAVTSSRADVRADRMLTQVQIRDLTRSGRVLAQRRGHIPRWAADGRIAWITSRRSQTSVVIADHDGAPLQHIDVEGDLSALTWAPDGTCMAACRRPPPAPRPANSPEVHTEYPYRFDGHGELDRPWLLTIIDVATGQSRDLPATLGAHDPCWHPDGTRLAFAADLDASPPRPHRSDVWIVDARGGAPTRLTAGLGDASDLAFSPDGARIAYLSHNNGDASADRHRRLWTVASDGSGSPSLTEPRHDRDAGAQSPRGQQLTWTADGTGLLYLSSEDGAVGLRQVQIDAGRGRWVILADEQLDAFDSTSDGHIVATTQWPDRFPSVDVVTPDGRRMSLPGGNDELGRTRRLLPLQRRSWTVDTREVRGLVVLPERGVAPYPLVVDIHGGPHAYHPYPGAPPHVQSLAAAGYAVALPNPRGSGGRSERWKRAVTGNWGRVDAADISGVVDALIAEGTADPNALYLHGTSYGGYLAALITTRQDRFRAAAIGAMMVNLVSAAGTSDIPEYWAHQVGDVTRGTGALMRASPITFVARVRTPMVIFHWTGDLRCPPTQSDEWFAALRRLGVPSTLVRYPDGGHTQRTPSQQVDKINRILDWFASYGPR